MACAAFQTLQKEVWFFSLTDHEAVAHAMLAARVLHCLGVEDWRAWKSVHVTQGKAVVGIRVPVQWVDKVRSII
jgi:hypothetical protein